MLETNESSSEKVNVQKQMTKMGQPRKYSEPTKHVSFSLPVIVVENLKILLALKRTNQTQLMMTLINAELKSTKNF